MAYLTHQTLFSCQVRQTSASIRGFPVFLPVSFDDGVIAQTGTVGDISREGGRIQCTGAVPDMKYIRVEIQLDDPHETLAVDLAVMRWSRNGEFGVEFIRMESDQQARLRNQIRSCEKALSRQDHQPVHQIKVREPLLAVNLAESVGGPS